MNHAYPAAGLHPSDTVGEVSRRRMGALWMMTLAFWGVNFGVATLANVLEDDPDLTLKLLMRSGLYLFGLALCFVLYRVQAVGGRSVFSRLGVLALAALPAAGMCAWGSLAIAQYVSAEIATVSEIIRTAARWLWFFVGWSAASLAVDYYFGAREVAGSSDQQAPPGQFRSRSNCGEATENLRLWIGFEVTSDVSCESRSAGRDFSKAFNHALETRPWRSSLTNVDVVLVVMNPDIVPPVAEAAILRPELNRFDCRVRLDFSQWIEGSRRTHIRLIKEAVSNALGQVPQGVIGRLDRKRFSLALENAAAVLTQDPPPGQTLD